MTDVRLDPEALLALAPDLIAQWRQQLHDVGLDGALVARAEAIAPGQLDRVRLPLVHAWLRGLDAPVAPWARLLAYRDTVPDAEVRAALGDRLTDALVAAGALSPDASDDDGPSLRSHLRLMPFADLVIASDEADARHDPVMGPGATTLELWRATDVPPGATVLDVGCGAGSLALAAARHGAGSVVGVDLDPRAVAYSRFNARLNGLPQARFEAGSLLQPVAGQTFDLVLCQPPFVTQPAAVATTTYLHGGHRGDELALLLLAGLRDAIAVGGRALVLLDTAPPAGQTVAQRLGAALGTTGLQVLVVSAEGHRADQQAVGYAAATFGDLGPEYAAAVASYRAHLAGLGITDSRHVLLDVHRCAPGASSWLVGVTPRGAAVYDAAALAEMRAGAQLVAAGPVALRQATIHVSPHAWLAEARCLADSSQRTFQVRFEGGRARDQVLSEAAAVLLEVIADAADLDTVVARYAEICDTTGEAVFGAVVQFVCDALVSGLLVTPVSPRPEGPRPEPAGGA